MNPMDRPRLPLLFALTSVLALGSGCASTLRIHVSSTEETNRGQILYMMVRAADDGTALLNEDYEQASSQVFAVAASASMQDAAEKKVQAILPGKPVTFSMPRPDKKRLALYFFFSEPGTHWMTPIEPPIPSEIHVTLGTREIKELAVQRR